jgi:hypothetical protein
VIDQCILRFNCCVSLSINVFLSGAAIKIGTLLKVCGIHLPGARIVGGSGGGEM